MPSTSRSHKLVRRLFLAAVTAAASLLYANKAHGVVVSGAPLAEPADGWVGTFNGSSCVAVGKSWFVTAKHVGGGVDNYVLMRGTWYRVVEVVPHPMYDAQLLRVAEELPGFHHLASGVQLGDPCLLGGWGVTTAGPLANNSGYDWNGPRMETWGANVIEGVGVLFTTRFDPPTSSDAVPHEAIFAVNDSGAGLFVYGADGSLELAGIAVSVLGWGSSQWSNSSFALSTDLLRNWMSPIVDPTAPVSSAVEAPRAMMSLPGLPVWAGGALVAATLAGLRKRRAT